MAESTVHRISDDLDATVSGGLPPPRMRLWRSVVAGTIVAAMIFSGFGLTDDAWPFAPFRMFSHANRLDGVAHSIGFAGTTAAGDDIRLDALDFGLRRAEVEGQRPRVLANPGMLADLAETWNAAHAGDNELVRLEMLEIGRRIEDGRPTEHYDETLMVWEAP